MTTEPKINPDEIVEHHEYVDGERDIEALRGFAHDLLNDLDAAYHAIAVAYERLDGAGR